MLKGQFLMKAKSIISITIMIRSMALEVKYRIPILTIGKQLASYVIRETYH